MKDWGEIRELWMAKYYFMWMFSFLNMVKKDQKPIIKTTNFEHIK